MMLRYGEKLEVSREGRILVVHQKLIKMEDKELLQKISAVINEYESKLTHKSGGNELDRVSHCLREYRSISDNAIWKAKEFVEDVKTMFKALEMIIEGISGDGMNHGQKRVIANHCIQIIRSNVDRINKMDFEYSSNIFDRFDFFRSQTPEKRLYEKNREMETRIGEAQIFIDKLKSMFPDAIKKIEQETYLPF